MYQSDITKENSTYPIGTRILDICGKEYVAYPSDIYIDEAIKLVSHWPPEQISFERIAHLHQWIRESDRYGYKIPYKHLRDMQGCRYFVESVIEAEYGDLKDKFNNVYEACIRNNIEIFCT